MEEIDILELIPQRRPFVMVDRLLHCDSQFTLGSLRILPDNIFVENGVLTESGIIESIAQTCAARMGYVNRLEQKKSEEQSELKVKLGFIGSIKNLLITQCPPVNEDITIKIEVLSEVFSIMLIQAEVKTGDEIIASGEMKISITNIDSKQ
jgi:3-hydroxymyristoyl/3-hydroxydecanoyl-(acyl carrier protein) dehydratase